MELVEHLPGIAIGVVGSLLATLIYNKLLVIKSGRIRKKIEDLDLEEDFLEKVSKGNVSLLRSSFKLLFLIIGVSFIALGLFIFSHYYEFPRVIKLTIYLLSAVMLITVGAVSFSHAFTLRKLDNLNESKITIEQRRKKLRGKLN